MQKPVILWFRNDLRLADNPALAAAIASGKPVIPVFILEEAASGSRPAGAAARWWLHHSLKTLDEALQARGSGLLLLQGPALPLLEHLVRETGADTVLWNRRYDAMAIETDAGIKADLKAAHVDVRSFNGHLLHEPWEIRSQSGTPFKVFTPFWKACLLRGAPRPALPAPDRISTPAGLGAGCTLDSLELLPTKPDWAVGFRGVFTPGEAGAMARLETFLHDDMPGYADNRDRPDKRSTSMLSPHLRFGDISPVQIWHAAQMAVETGASKASARDLGKLLAEIGWREFSYHLLHQAPELATRNFQPKFDSFPWRTDDVQLRAWQQGQTGYPIVDAGMRQLWQTGWMHNRVRMIVASFLIKHLLIDWREGERWFWETLVDADVASNPASWQWVAGSGADAAPYYRIFNPVLQGEKFDPDGHYVRRYVPELADLCVQYLHRPWEAPPHELRRAGIDYGKSYPRPIIDHAFARQRALDALKEVSGAVGSQVDG